MWVSVAQALFPVQSLLWSVRLGAQRRVLLPARRLTLHVDACPMKLYHAHRRCGPYAAST
jgi:hypothetical protein